MGRSLGGVCLALLVGPQCSRGPQAGPEAPASARPAAQPELDSVVAPAQVDDVVAGSEIAGPEADQAPKPSVQAALDHDESVEQLRLQLEATADRNLEMHEQVEEARRRAEELRKRLEEAEEGLPNPKRWKVPLDRSL